MEETEETLGVWDKLAEFFLDDDQSRWKAIRWITAIVGTLGAIDLLFFNAPIDETVFLMGFALLLMSVLWLAWYTSFSRSQKEKHAAAFMTRRDLIWQGASLFAFLAAVRVQRAEARSVEHKLQEAGSDPTNPSNIAEVGMVVAKAKSAGIKVPMSVVGDVGKKFVEATEINPAALNAVIACIEYKSFSNNFPSLLPDTTNVPAFRGRYLILKHGAPPTTSLKGLAPADSAAQTGYIGEDRNKGLAYGPAWIVYESGDVDLDEIQLRNVVFRNVHISYLGGPTIIKNVYFIDCTFNVNTSPNARQFAKAILVQASSTSFQSNASIS
jgi:hypothetical protein